MKLGIDASNLRAGGGVTHLVELLRVADPSIHGFASIVVWAGQTTLQYVEDRPWLEKCHQPILDRNLFCRVYWQRFRLSDMARQAGCDVLFVPGGSYAGNFRPIVTMSRNMLPFEWRELQRYGMSVMTLKLLLLRWSQSRSFRRADGVIFLTGYARNTVLAKIESGTKNTTIIPHGIHPRFSSPPRHQLPVSDYSVARPFTILYVSLVDWYKHQWHVVEAVVQLRKEGLPVALDLVGPASPPALTRLVATLKRVDPDGTFVRYFGPVPHAELHARYILADLYLFASSCENMPNILLEGMVSGLPIACSNRGPMPEILKSGGAYFDPEKPSDIAAAIRLLIMSPALREEKATLSFSLAQQYSWQRCAGETLRFLSEMVRVSRMSQLKREKLP